MSIAGIDYSLKSPAICIFMGNSRAEFKFSNCLFFYLTDVKKNARSFGKNITGELFSSYNEECERYDSISEWACDKVVGCNQVALEGYAYNAKGASAFQLAENMGILKYKIFEMSLPLDVVTPTEVKKFATTKGNADKEQMHFSFTKETKVNMHNKITPDKSGVGNPVSDIVDAYFICRWMHSKMNAL